MTELVPHGSLAGTDFRRVPTDAGIAELLTWAVADAEKVARAEIELQKAKLLVKVAEARNAVVFLVVAILVGSLALIALVVGLLLALATLVGPGFATLIVFGTLLIVAGAFGWLALRQVKLLTSGTAAPE